MSSPSERALRARLDELRRGGRDHVPYQPPTADEARLYGEWVRRMAEASRGGALPEEGAPPGFSVEVLPAAPRLWLLVEREGGRRGAGVVVLRRDDASDAMFEAPHTFFDQGTLPIAVVAFESQKARALVINTVHRFRAEHLFSDVAHAQCSFFLAAHEAMLVTFSGLFCVQLHGFSDDAESGARVILSAAGSVARVPAASVSAVVGDGVRVYPDDIRKLGGMTNVQASASRRAGAPFLHVEMDRALRDRLVSDEALAARFAGALVAPVREGAPGR